MGELMTAPGLLPVLLSGFLFSLLAPLVNQLFRDYAGRVIALLPLAMFVYFLSLLGDVANGVVFTAQYDWVPSLNIQLNFMVDGWGLFLALIVSGIGALVIFYAGGYLQGDEEIGRFYVFILVFMASMLVLVLADDIFLLFIAWELTSISSFFLIGFYHEKESSQKAALQALLVTGGGGLLMLAGLIGLALITGSSSFSQILANRDLILQSEFYLPVLALILLGAFTKSAQFPFHFWLPNAMAGPAPVSTYLHSATMVKAGVYLLARLQPVLGDTGEWFYTLTIVGGFTALLGAWLSWQKTDLKAILAYSTVSALGTLVLLIGIGTKFALETAVLFLLVHALYKGGLFMAAGIIDHETGVRDVRQLGGLRHEMPFTFTAVLLAALAMAGVPPFLGFVGKELMYETGLDLSAFSLLITGVLLLTNMLMVAVALILVIRPFLGQRQAAQPAHKTPAVLWLGPLILGVLGLIFGLFVSSGAISGALLSPPAGVIYGEPLELHLALWHGFTPMLALSLVTWLGGAAWYLVHGRLLSGANRLDEVLQRAGPAKWYEWSLNGTLAAGSWFTELFQNGKLRYYLFYVIASSLVAVGGTLVFQGGVPWQQLAIEMPPLPELILALVILGAIGVIVQVESRLTAVAALGVIGYGIAVFYILFSAPDLAMTQFSIETLTVILFVLVLYRLPRFDRFSSGRTRMRDAFMAGLVGLLMAGLTLMAQLVHGSSALTDYFANNSYSLAKGYNIVNVILVDFRGFDTLVEITVLSVAAIGVYALLKSRLMYLQRDAQAAGRHEHPQTDGARIGGLPADSATEKESAVTTPDQVKETGG